MNYNHCLFFVAGLLVAFAYDIRQRGRFAGFLLFVSKTGDIQGATLCYKDGPKLPPLNFTTICTESGRYVIFYNERLDRVIYPNGYEVTNLFTELCEVTVQGCSKASVYGSSCDIPCPTNCKDDTCHIQIGACLNCKPGWTGVFCNTKCTEGWYGVNCSQQCVGHCKDGDTCSHVNGQCDRGCDAGWTRAMCEKDCLDCPSGQFGWDCKERCSRHCINNEPCDHVSGVCPSGCQDGYIGARCNNSCDKGYFGTNCSGVCSPYCKPDTCRHTDGYCTCSVGWTGNNCATECTMSYGENCRHRCNIHCMNQTCDRINGFCLYGCKEGEQCEIDSEHETLPSRSSFDNLPFSIGGIVGACLVIIFGAKTI